jgi:hypothetical protein
VLRASGADQDPQKPPSSSETENISLSIFLMSARTRAASGGIDESDCPAAGPERERRGDPDGQRPLRREYVTKSSYSREYPTVTGTFHLARYLTLDSQKSLAAECLSLGSATAGFYTPVVRGMHPMSVKMLCLGRHWNAVTYRYEATRSDVDGCRPHRCRRALPISRRASRPRRASR